jgi:hypothetical protein
MSAVSFMLSAGGMVPCMDWIGNLMVVIWSGNGGKEKSF